METQNFRENKTFYQVTTLHAQYQNPRNMRFHCTDQLYFDIFIMIFSLGDGAVNYILIKNQNKFIFIYVG